jgi:predicted dehydrogenase
VLSFLTVPRPAGLLVRVYGASGWIEVDFEARTTRLRAATPLPSLVTKLHAPFAASRQGAAAVRKNAARLLRGDLHYFAGLQRLCRLFYQAILEGREAPLDRAHVQRVAWLTDAVIDAVAAPREAALEYDAG